MSDPCPHQAACAAVPAHARFHAVAACSGLAALRALALHRGNVGLPGLASFAVDDTAAAQVRDDLSAHGVDHVLLRTCNRIELYWRARVPGDDERASRAFAGAVGLDESTFALAARFDGEAAAEHLFRVASGLESLVVGEAEILGQLRDALAQSSAAGSFLDGLFRAALRTGRAARAETAIGAGAMSVASTAVHALAEHVALATSRVVLVGAGDTAQKVGRHLRAVGVASLTIANRTRERAERLAATLHAGVVELPALGDVIASADALVCAATAPTPLVSAALLRRARAGRESLPLTIVDLAMPRGVEPTPVGGVTLIGLDGLERLAAAHRERRLAEVPKVEAVIAREMGWLRAWARHQALHPLVSGLRQKVEGIRRVELARVVAELRGAQVDEATALERLSRRLLDQVLAIPLAALEDDALPLDPTHADYLKRLFALDAGNPCA